MHHHHLPTTRTPRRREHACGERRSGGAHQGVLAAVVALALCAWLVVVQHDAPELDASTARASLVVLDDLLAAADGGENR